jgi:hypothetical protein
MRGRIIAEILVHNGVRHENSRSAFPFISGFLIQETHEKQEGLCIFG